MLTTVPPPPPVLPLPSKPHRIIAVLPGMYFSPCRNVLVYLPLVHQIENWSSNPDAFVEDEDEDSFAYSVRISAQDLLLVSGSSPHLILHSFFLSLFPSFLPSFLFPLLLTILPFLSLLYFPFLLLPILSFLSSLLPWCVNPKNSTN